MSYTVIPTRTTGDANSAADVNALMANDAAHHISVAVPGVVFSYTGITTPTGFLACDGSAISRSTYADLYSAVTASKGTCTISIASPGVVTLNSHGLATGDCIELTTTGALPTGLTANTNHYVVYNDANSFWLATTLANAIAGTKINTSGSQSGTHTLRYCPWGISTSTNFLLPDLRGVFLKGNGQQATAAWGAAAYAGYLGQYRQDQGQGHIHGLYGATAVGTSHGIGDATNGKDIQGSNSTTGQAYVYTLVGGNKPVSAPYTDGTNGTPRTGSTTEPARAAVNYIIKY